MQEKVYNGKKWFVGAIGFNVFMAVNGDRTVTLTGRTMKEIESKIAIFK